MDHTELKSCIKVLKMPSVLEHFAEFAQRAGKERWSFERYLYELLTVERENRRRCNAVLTLAPRSQPASRNSRS